MGFVRKTELQSSQSLPDTQKIFIGRTGELLFFTQNILKPEEPTHNIVSISGQGGVGKSALLKQFISKARTSGFKDFCLIAIVNERQVTVASIMEKFADQLRDAGYPLTNFEEALVHYKEALRKLQAEQENMRNTVLRKTATDVAGSVAKSVPVMGGLLEGVARATTEFVVDEFHYRRLLKDAERLEDPIRDLTYAFVDDLNFLANSQVTFGAKQVKRERRLILFFDTFERLAAEATSWLLDYFLEAAISPNVVLVLAGRDPIERSTPNDPKRWLPYLDDNTIYQIYLNSFTEEETRKYLAARNITDSERISTIWELSRGLPLYLSLLTSNPQGKVDPTADVVANFLRWIPEQEQNKRRLALDAALFSRPFNQDELEAFIYLPENDRSSLFNWLTELPFVQSSLQDGRYSYHEMIQELFARHLYRRSQKEYRNTRKALADYYSEMLQKKQIDGGKEVYHTAEWLELSIALAQQLFLLPDEISHVKAIEQILIAYQNVDQEELIVRAIRDLSIKQFNNQMSPNSRKIASMLLQYTEAHLTKHGEDSLEAINFLLEKVEQAAFFSVKLLANLYYQRGEANRILKIYQHALAAFNRAIELAKGNAEPFFARAQTYQAMKRYEEALADFARAIELDPGFAHLGQEHKGDILRSLQEYEKAADAYIKAIVADPTCMLGWESLLKVYRNSHARHKIPELLRAIPFSDGITNQALVNRAKVMSEIQLYEEAIIDIGFAIERNPEDAHLFQCRGEIFANQKLYENAIADFTSAIKIVPNFARAIISRAGAYRNIGRNEEALVDYNGIIEYYSDSQPVNKEERIERNDNLYVVRNQRGRVYPYRSLDIALCERGLVYRIMGHYEEALTDFDRAIELDEDNVEPVFARAQTYRDIGRYEEALTDFDHTIELNPGFAHIGHKERGLIFNTLHRYQDAVDALFKALAAHPACVECWTLLARTYSAIYSPSEVPKLLREISILDSNADSVIFYRTLALKNTEHYEEAIADLTRTIENNPDKAQFINLRGQIYKELRRYEEALADLTRIIELDNSLIKDFWNEQGLMLSYLGRYNEAIESYEHKLKENSDKYSTLYNIAVAMARADLPTAQTYIGAARSALQNLVKNNIAHGPALYGLGGLEALVGHSTEALDYLEQAVSLVDQAIDWAKHDVAWLDLRDNERFHLLITKRNRFDES